MQMCIYKEGSMPPVLWMQRRYSRLEHQQLIKKCICVLSGQFNGIKAEASATVGTTGSPQQRRCSSSSLSVC